MAADICEVSEHAKKAAQLIDGAITDYMAALGVKKITGGKVQAVVEKVVQLAINEALVEALTDISTRAMEEVYGRPNAAKHPDA